MDHSIEHSANSVRALINSVNGREIDGKPEPELEKKFNTAIQIATLYFSRQLPQNTEPKQKVYEMIDTLVESGVDKDWISPLPGNPAGGYLEMFCNDLVTSLRMSTFQIDNDKVDKRVIDEVDSVQMEYANKSSQALKSALESIDFSIRPDAIQNQVAPYSYNRTILKRLNNEIRDLNSGYYKDMMHYGIDWKISV